VQVARLNPEKSIPQAVLKGARGLAILTVAKAGALFTYKLGTGLVASRRSDGSWSAPSAIFSVGLGWGAQVGKFHISLFPHMFKYFDIIDDMEYWEILWSRENPVNLS